MVKKNEEYCIIYGTTDNNPGPFVLAVSNDQEMINGFREEHYHICRGGEIVNDSRYDIFAGDYEIQEYMGHYMTQRMITDFCQYCTSIFNSLWSITDTIERELQYIKFNPDEQSVVDDGFGLLCEILSQSAPIETRDIMEQGHIYADVLYIEKCLEGFLATYQPSGY